jgi:hypothetical protein
MVLFLSFPKEKYRKIKYVKIIHYINLLDASKKKLVKTDAVVYYLIGGCLLSILTPVLLFIYIIFILMRSYFLMQW